MGTFCDSSAGTPISDSNQPLLFRIDGFASPTDDVDGVATPSDPLESGEGRCAVIGPLYHPCRLFRRGVSGGLLLLLLTGCKGGRGGACCSTLECTMDPPYSMARACVVVAGGAAGRHSGAGW